MSFVIFLINLILIFFFIFIVEIVAFRWGTARLKRLGLAHEAHGHGLATHAAHGPETDHDQQRVAESLRDAELNEEKAAAQKDTESSGSGPHAHFPHAHSDKELESGRRAQNQDAPDAVGDSAAAQIIGIAILEFGVLLHSVLIGLTLAVDEQFTILFVVIIFHRKSSWVCVGWWSGR